MDSGVATGSGSGAAAAAAVASNEGPSPRTGSGSESVNANPPVAGLANPQTKQQYQYLQQQQLAHQAFTRQLQMSSDRAEPIGIPGGSRLPQPNHQEEASSDSNEDDGDQPTSDSIIVDEVMTAADDQSTQLPITSATSANPLVPISQNSSLISQNLLSSGLFPQGLQQQQQQPQQQQLQQQQHPIGSGATGASTSRLPRSLSQQSFFPSSSFQPSLQQKFPGAHPRLNSTSSMVNVRTSGFSMSPAASSFFSPSSASRFVPNTNEPSSVSSSYKSAVPPSSSYQTAYSPYSNQPTNQPSLSQSSFSDRQPPPFLHNSGASLFSQQQQGQTSTWNVSRGFRHSSVSSNTSPSAMNPESSPRSDPPDVRSRIPSISDPPPSIVTQQKNPPTIRTSLLTSKLAAGSGTGVGIANIPPPTSSLQMNNAPSLFGGVGSTASPSSSFTNSSAFPYPNPRTNSFRGKHSPFGTSPYSSDPQFFSTSNPTRSSRFSIPNNAEDIQDNPFRSHQSSLSNALSFMPHPSSTTTNITMAMASGTSTPHSMDSDGNQQQQSQPQVQLQGQTEQPQLQSDNSPAAMRTSPDIGPVNTEDSAIAGPEHLDIASYPVPDVIVMLSALLQKIIDANDALHPQQFQNATQSSGDYSITGPNKFTANVLAFHGRNIPAIGLQSYLSRILKYCPTTNEVFISLLVYFDRIAQRANAGEFLNPSAAHSTPFSSGFEGSNNDNDNNTNNNNNNNYSPSNSADAMIEDSNEATSPASTATVTAHNASMVGIQTPASSSRPTSSSTPSQQQPQPHQLFVMDSYNIHRLIIAGVTVASKFFSDVFYKNSRYAKVGGLPVDELNHLELQFLLLTDFHLMIPLEELQRYADLLLRFWKKEQLQNPDHSSE